MLGVLVAMNAKGCYQICTEVRTVPKACPVDPSTGGKFESCQQPLALCTVGAGHHRSVSLGNGQLQVCFSSRGLLH